MKFDLKRIYFTISLVAVLLFCFHGSVSAAIIFTPPCVTDTIIMSKLPDLTTVIIKPQQTAAFTNFSVTNMDSIDCPARSFSATVDLLPPGWTVKWLDPASGFIPGPINITLGPGQVWDFPGIIITPPNNAAFGEYLNIDIKITALDGSASALINVEISDAFVVDTSLLTDIDVSSDGNGWNSTIVYGLDEMTTLPTNDVTPVTFSLSGLPAGATSTFILYSNSPTACIPLATGPIGGGCARKLIINTIGVAVGIYPITETITNGYNTEIVTFNLNVDNSATCGNNVQEIGEVCDYSATPTGCVSPLMCNISCNSCVAPDCGNTIKDVGETCDYSATPTGCIDFQVCNASCTSCVNNSCGDGMINIGEACDFSVTLTGCIAPQVCNAGCTSCIIIPCGNAAMDAGEACDFSATPTGCAAPYVCNASCSGCIGGGCAPNTCNPPNQYCFDGSWFNCPGGATCSGAGICGVSTFDNIFTNPSVINSAKDLAPRVIDWFLAIAAAIAILFLIIGGIIYITATGDEDRMWQGKRIITYAIFGLVIILISYSIVLTLNNIIF